MLLILATCRGVWVTLEQPASSTMHYLPDFVATAQAIQQHLGIWKEQFLQGSQKAICHCGVWMYSNSIALFTHEWRSIYQHWLPDHLPSWMASWGAPTCKPSKLWGTPLQPQRMTHATVVANMSSDLWCFTNMITSLERDHSNFVHLIPFDCLGLGCQSCSGLSVKPTAQNLLKLVSGWKLPPKRRNQMDQCQCPSLSNHQMGYSLKRHHFLSCYLLLSTRSGGKGLKATQVYPKGFGVKLLNLHKSIQDHLACLSRRWRTHIERICKQRSINPSIYIYIRTLNSFCNIIGSKLHIHSPNIPFQGFGQPN